MSAAPDFGALALIHAAAFAGEGEAWSAAALRTLAEAPGAALVCEPTGFVLLRCAGGEAEVLTLAVAPERRRAGAGRRLMTEALRHAAAMGAGTVFLEVAADNVAACGLYAALGFTQVGVRRGYYRRAGGLRCDALALRCALSCACGSSLD